MGIRPKTDSEISFFIRKNTKLVGECKRFIGNHTKSGYGRVYYKGKFVRVHRLVMYLFNNFDLNSLELILHLPNICKFRDCWNLDHLYIGSAQDNVNDIKISGDNFNYNKIYCKHGHEFTKENTRIKSNGARDCLECNRIRMREKYHKA